MSNSNRNMATEYPKKRLGIQLASTLFALIAEVTVQAQTCNWVSLQHMHDVIVQNLHIGSGSSGCFPFAGTFSQTYMVPGARNCTYSISGVVGIFTGNYCLGTGGCFGDDAYVSVYRYFNGQAVASTVFQHQFAYLPTDGSALDSCFSGWEFPGFGPIVVQGEDVIEVDFITDGGVSEVNPGMAFSSIGISALQSGPSSDITFDLPALPMHERPEDFVFAQMTQPNNFLHPSWDFTVPNGSSIQTVPDTESAVEVTAGAGSLVNASFTLRCKEGLFFTDPNRPLDWQYGISQSSFTKSLTILPSPHIHGDGLAYAGGPIHHQLSLSVDSPGVFNAITWEFDGSSLGCTLTPTGPKTATLTMGNTAGRIFVIAKDTSVPLYSKEAYLDIEPKPTIQVERILSINRTVQASLSDNGAFQSVFWSLSSAPSGCSVTQSGRVTAGSYTGTIVVRATDADGYYVESDPIPVSPKPDFYLANMLMYNPLLVQAACLVVGDSEPLELFFPDLSIFEDPVFSFKVGTLTRNCQFVIDGPVAAILPGDQVGPITIVATDFDGYSQEETFVVRPIPTLTFDSNPIRSWGGTTRAHANGNFAGGTAWWIPRVYNYPGATPPNVTIDSAGNIVSGNVKCQVDIVGYDPTMLNCPLFDADLHDCFDWYDVFGTLTVIAGPPPGGQPYPAVVLNPSSVPTGGTVKPVAFINLPDLMNGVIWGLVQLPGQPDLGCTISPGGVITPGNVAGQVGVVALDSILGASYTAAQAVLTVVRPTMSFNKTVLVDNGIAQTTAVVDHPEVFPGGITWSISAGSAYATMPSPAVIRSKSGVGNGTVTVRATSVSQPSLFTENSIHVKAMPTIAFSPTYLIADNTSRTTATASDSEVFPTAVWSIDLPNLGAKVINASSGLLEAGSNPGTITVRATSPAPDGYQITGTLNIKVDATIQFSKASLQADGISTATASIDPLKFPNVSWSLVTTVAGTTIDATGVIHAGRTAGQIQVQAKDTSTGLVIDQQNFPIKPWLRVVFDVISLKADGKSKAWASLVPPGALANVTWSIQGPDLGCTITPGGRVSAATTGGRVTVRASDASDASFYGEAQLRVDDKCMTDCASGNCLGGGGTANNNSVDVAISLGYANYGSREVIMRIKQSLPTTDLISPAKLWVAGLGTDVEVYPTSGTIQQVKSPYILAVVTDVTTTGYNVKLYSNDQLGSHTPGTPYVVLSGQQPFCTWSIVNPVPNNINLVRVTETRGSRSYVADYSYSSDANGSGWDMVIDGGTRKERRKRLGNVETYTIRDATTDAVKYQEARTYQTFPWNVGDDELVNLTIGTGANAHTTTWNYYTDPANVGNYKHISKVILPGGSWELYYYDLSGRKTRVVSQFLDSPLPTTPTAEDNNRVDTFVYDDLNDTTEELTKLKNIEIAHKYTVRASQSGEDVVSQIVCQNRGVTSITGVGNLTTKTKSFPSGNQFEFQPHLTERPDGTLLAYTYSITANQKTTTIKEGQPNVAHTDVTDGIKTVTVTDLAGNLISEQQFDLGDISFPLSSKVASSRDNFGRTLTYTYGDSSFESLTYTCCGTDTFTDRAGVATQYDYDNLKRVKSITKAGITILTQYNLLGKAQTETRVSPNAGGTVSKVLHSYLYDDAGLLIQSSDLIGNTTYLTTTEGGDRVVTTTFPNASTKIEKFYPDGHSFSVGGTALYPSSIDYGIDVDGAFVTETRSEIVKTYVDLLQRKYKVVFSANTAGQTPYSQNYYDVNSGQLWKQRDPDGVVTLLSYNTRGELYRKAVDIDRNDQISTDIDQVEEYALTLQAQAGTMLIVKHTYVWDKDGSNPAVRTERLIESSAVDGSYSSSSTFGQTTTRTVTYVRASRQRTETDTLPDNTQKVSVYVDNRLATITVMDNSSPRIQLGKTTSQYFTDGPFFGFLQNTIDARNGTTSYTYNARDQIDTMTTPAPGAGQTAPQVTRYFYDETNPLGRIETVTLTDQASVITRTYKLTGELKSVLGATVIPTEYDYQDGRIKTVKTWRSYGNDSTSEATIFTYTPDRGFLQSKAYAGVAGPSYTYYDSGKVKTRTFPNGATTTYVYNNAGELWKVDYSDTTANPDITYTYTSRGQLKTIVDQTGTQVNDYYTHGLPHTQTHTGGPIDGIVVEYNYDALLRQQNVVGRKGGVEVYRQAYEYRAGDSYVKNVTFDNVCAHFDYENNAALVSGTILKRTSETGSTILTGSRQHSFLNQLTQITTAGSGATISFSCLLNPLDKRQRITLQDGSYWLYSYDTHGQLNSAKKYWSDNSPVPGQQFEYTFDDIGNRLNTKSGGDLAGLNLRLTQYVPNPRNQYDSRDAAPYSGIYGSAHPLAKVTADRLVALRHDDYYWVEVPIPNSGGPASKSVTLRGARWNYSANRDVVTSVSRSLTVPAGHEVFVNTDPGNLGVYNSFNCAYDAENRIISLEQASITRTKLLFTYDYLGRRVQKVAQMSSNNGFSWFTVATTSFVYDGWNLLFEFDEAGGLIRSYGWGADDHGALNNAGANTPVLLKTYSNQQIGTVGTYYIGADLMGNVAGLFNVTDGTQSATYEYGPFGEPLRTTGTASSDCRVRFAGKYLDVETGLSYYGYRFYSPALGRWLGRDPLGEAGGGNLYAFVGNDPINNQDLLGLILWDDSDNMWVIFAGRMIDPRAQIENIVSGDSLRVANSYSKGVILAPVKLVGAAIHPIRTAQGLLALPGLISSGQLKCLLGQKYNEFLRASPEQQEEILGELVGDAAGGWAVGAGAGNLIQTIRASRAAQAARAARRLEEVSVGTAKRALTAAEKEFYDRVSHRQHLRGDVWDAASKNGTREVYDPTGRIIEESDNWQLGHLPEHKFTEAQLRAAEEGWTRAQWIEYQNDPAIYRPEFPLTNTGHAFEDVVEYWWGAL
jgi:RHS repeat-associated protein